MKEAGLRLRRSLAFVWIKMVKDAIEPDFDAINKKMTQLLWIMTQ